MQKNSPFHALSPTFPSVSAPPRLADPRALPDFALLKAVPLPTPDFPSLRTAPPLEYDPLRTARLLEYEPLSAPPSEFMQAAYAPSAPKPGTLTRIPPYVPAAPPSGDRPRGKAPAPPVREWQMEDENGKPLAFHGTLVQKQHEIARLQRNLRALRGPGRPASDGPAATLRREQSVQSAKFAVSKKKGSSDGNGYRPR
ncbi:MAG: hypothetical protein ACYDCO_24015 [Armatimonadota bacterium]